MCGWDKRGEARNDCWRFACAFSDLLNSEMMAVKLMLDNHMWEDAIELVEKNQSQVRSGQFVGRGISALCGSPALCKYYLFD